ncbi:MAG: helix-turn-helix transcriptional regulator [Candidatus Binatia bacterium]
MPDAIFAQRLAEIYGVTVEYLVKGKEREFSSNSPVSATVVAEFAPEDYGKKKRQETNGTDTHLTLRSIPILEDKIAAGPGQAVDFARVEDYALIPATRLHRQAQYYLLRISGDSMEPDLRPGDLILVNLSRNDPRQLKDRIVAAYLPDEGGATVKILREDETGKFWILQARNQSYRERVISKKDEGVQFAVVEGAWVNFETRG